MTLTTVSILSILEGNALDEAKRLWTLFETEYASKGVQSFDHPNLTFQAGRCRDVVRVSDALEAWGGRLRPFEVIIDGVGSFREPSRVVFLKVRLTEELREINRIVNHLLTQHCDKVFEHYLPENWVPHVTLAMVDLTEANFERAKRDLVDYHPRYRQVLSNIHLVRRCEETGRIEIVASYSCAQS